MIIAFNQVMHKKYTHCHTDVHHLQELLY